MASVLSSVILVGFVSTQLALVFLVRLLRDLPMLAAGPRGDYIHREVVVREVDLERPVLSLHPVCAELGDQDVLELVENLAWPQVVPGLGQPREYIDVLDPLDRDVPAVGADQDGVGPERRAQVIVSSQRSRHLGVGARRMLGVVTGLDVLEGILKEVASFATVRLLSSSSSPV